MAEDNKLVPRDVPTNGSIEILGAGSRFAAFDLSPASRTFTIIF